MELLTAARHFNGASQSWPYMNREPQEVLSLLWVFPEPFPSRPFSFSSVATNAGCHEIPCGMIASFYERLHVVDRQPIVGEGSRAVNAAICIAAEYCNALVVSLC